MQATTPRSARPPANARGRRTRVALLDAARSILEEHGFSELTMASVAEHAGVSRRAVYLHFRSRGELVGAMFDHVAETERLLESLELVRSAPDAVSALDEWARHEASYHSRILGVARALEHVGRDDPDAAIWRERIAQYQLVDCRLLAQRLADERRLASGWTVDSATDMLWALISTEPLDRLLSDRHWTAEQYTQRFSDLLRRTFVSA
jgi:AcrR family transcriptional regulator